MDESGETEQESSADILARDRFDDLLITAEYFCKVFSVKFSVAADLRPSPELIYLAAISICDDIERYKEYHLRDLAGRRSDVVKRAAYTVFWLNRVRPIVPTEQKPTDSLGVDHGNWVMVNQEFSLAVARAYISAETCKDFLYSDAKHAGLIYDLTYREITKDGLLAVFQDVVDAVLDHPLVTIY